MILGLPAAPARSRPVPVIRRAARARGSVPAAALVLALAGTGVFWWQLGPSVHSGLRVGLASVFLVLCLNVSLFVVTGVLGFCALLRGRPPSALAPARGGPGPGSRTAVLFPVCDEEPGLVFGNLRAVAESAAGELAADFFVISNSREPAQLAAERQAWQQVRDWVRYRVRGGPGRKAANVHEFCAVWGDDYDYLVVLDADSVMSGATLRQLVGLMEANPAAGLIEVPGTPVGGRTVFARLQQFAAAVYGPISAWGNRVWQRGNANYHGHNAIIRIAPFRAHCRLPELPGGAPFGGEILSHDFVEAALLRRAGWEVWSAPELGGSYEAAPPTMVAYARRDRRWCQGNLQHLRVIGWAGLTFTSRLHLARGVLQYLAAPLWLLFVAAHLFAAPPRTSALVLGVVAVWLTMRLLGVLGVLLTRRRGSWPAGRLLVGALTELVASVLVWPVLVLLHTRFIVELLAGRDTGWPQPDRDGAPIPFRRLLWFHRVELGTGAGVAGLCVVYPAVLTGWLVPVLAAWLGAAGLSAVTGRRSGRTLLLGTELERRPGQVVRRAAVLRRGYRVRRACSTRSAPPAGAAAPKGAG
ncbi:hypothetical protein GCM10010452_69300 [Crossiella cryophila]